MAYHKELEIDQDLAFQRREWLVQRIAWRVLTAFVLAAALGLFGGGPLSRARAGDSGDRLWIEYDRFVRVGARTRVSVHSAPAERGRADIQLRIARAYFDALRIERVTPEPTTIDIGPDEVSMRFEPPIAAGGPFTIVLDVQPRRAGLQSAAFDNAQGTGVTFTQLVYF